MPYSGCGRRPNDGGKLESTKQQNVQVDDIENKQVIEIKPADPQVIYVPSYSPTVVYGPPVYAYPPIAYPTYSTGAMVTTAAVSFGVGVMMGAMWSGCCHGGYGWGMGMGRRSITTSQSTTISINVTATRMSAEGTVLTSAEAIA